MGMTPQAMIQLLSSAKEDDERLEEIGDSVAELADDEKKVDVGVIEALFKIYERLHDPTQALFNALESCAMGPQEKTVRRLARESALRQPNHCNLQLVGDAPESIKLLKELENRPGLDSELRTIIKDMIQEAQES